MGLRLIFLIVTRAVSLLGLSRREEWWKDAEILMLRHQLAVAQRERPRAHARLTWLDRAWLALLAGSVPPERLAAMRLIVTPGTIVRWHRDIVRRRWARRSRRGRSGRPATHRNVRSMVLRLARENEAWGYRRIHGELAGLGITVAPSTVWQILKNAGISPAPRRDGPGWAEFPRSQAQGILALDFFTADLLNGAKVYVLAAIEHGTRRIRILGATEHPIQSRVVQQARNLLMDLDDAGMSLKFILHDRDAGFTAAFDAALQAAGTRVAQPHVSFTRQPSQRGRPVWVPDRLPRLDAARALARVELPLHLNWSSPGRVFDLRSRADRARVYETVLQEGRPADNILKYVDGALLADLWDELVLPRAVRSAWEPLMTPSGRAASSAARDGRPGLPAFQLEVARVFFALPASSGFLLAGGAALLAQHLTARPTEDLDFFTAPDRGHVSAARDALEAAARQRGWSTERIHDSGTFCRMVIRSAGAGVLVNLAVNAQPDLPPSVTPAGPTLAPEELAGHKLLALFDRAAARDFADVYVLANRFGKDPLITRATQIDAGFDIRVLADMMATLNRFTDSEIAVPSGSSAAELRAFYAAWQSELTA